MVCFLFVLTTLPVIAQNNLQSWTRTYNGSGGNADDSRKVATDASGNIYVTGTIYNTISGNTTNDFVIIKYNSSGTQLWLRTYNGGVNYNDQLQAMVLDGSANVYVTGKSHLPGQPSRFHTRKYNSAGTFQWSKTYIAADEFSLPTAIAFRGLVE